MTKVLALGSDNRMCELQLGSLPFFLADSTSADIPLAIAGALPFYLADGTESDISMVVS